MNLKQLRLAGQAAERIEFALQGAEQSFTDKTVKLLLTIEEAQALVQWINEIDALGASVGVKP